jgi:hypothetical protein
MKDTCEPQQISLCAFKLVALTLGVISERKKDAGLLSVSGYTRLSYTVNSYILNNESISTDT